MLGKFFGAALLAGILVGIESMFSVSTGFGSVIPLQAHIFVLAFLLLYLIFTVGEGVEKLAILVRIQEAATSMQPPEP